MRERETPEVETTEHRSPDDLRRPQQAESKRRPTPTLTDENPLIFRGLGLRHGVALFRLHGLFIAQMTLLLFLNLCAAQIFLLTPLSRDVLSAKTFMGFPTLHPITRHHHQ